MIKWLPPNGPTQHSTCKRYAVVEANSQTWIAYFLLTPVALDLQECPSPEKAREACEEHERTAHI